MKQNHYLCGKGTYKREQLELTIPSRFRDVVGPFLYKDLKVEARREGNSLVIEARLVETPLESS